MTRKEKIIETLSIHCQSTSEANINRLAKEKGEYIFYCSWGSGNQYSMGHKKDIEDTVIDMMNRGYDDGYSLSVWNIENKKEVKWDVKISCTLTEV